MSEQKSNGGESGLIHIFSGLGIGLLIGIIVGLSVSPVVSVILGALASLLAVFLGLQEGLGTNVGQDEAQYQKVTQRLRVSSLKAGSFGFACVAGILIGLFIRNTEAFSPSMADRINELTTAGFSQDYARELVVFQKYGINPKTGEVQYTEMQKAQTGALFADVNPEDFCGDLSMDKYGNDVEKVLRAYRRRENDQLTQLADAIEQLNIPVENQSKLIIAIEEVICGLKK